MLSILVLVALSSQKPRSTYQAQLSEEDAKAFAAFRRFLAFGAANRFEEWMNPKSDLKGFNFDETMIESILLELRLKVQVNKGGTVEVITNPMLDRETAVKSLKDLRKSVLSKTNSGKSKKASKVRKSSVSEHHPRAPSKLAALISDFDTILSFEHMVQPYAASGRPVETFIDAMLAVNLRSDIFRALLQQILAEGDHDRWFERMDSILLKVEDAEDATRSCFEPLHRVLMRFLCQSLVLDSLVRDLQQEPLKFLKPMDTMYRAYLTEPKLLDLSGLDICFLVKFPSIQRPVEEFVTAQLQKHERDIQHFDQNLKPQIVSAAKLGMEAAAKRHMEAAAELKIGAVAKTLGVSAATTAGIPAFEEEGAYENFILRMMNRIISKDPTRALRLNILEAALAAIFFYPDEQAYKDPTTQLPHITISGFILMADVINGLKPQGNIECKDNAHCWKIFMDGRFEFSDTKEWMDLYNGWNMALMFISTTAGDWVAKLTAPAILDDKTGATYITRRVIALWLTLFRKAFMNHDFKYSKMYSGSTITGPHVFLPRICRANYVVRDNYDMSSRLGELTAFYGREMVKKLWASEKCVECEKEFDRLVNTHQQTQYAKQAMTKVVDMMKFVPKSVVEGAYRLKARLLGQKDKVEKRLDKPSTPSTTNAAELGTEDEDALYAALMHGQSDVF